MGDQTIEAGVPESEAGPIPTREGASENRRICCPGRWPSMMNAIGNSHIDRAEPKATVPPKLTPSMNGLDPHSHDSAIGGSATSHPPKVIARSNGKQHRPKVIAKSSGEHRRVESPRRHELDKAHEKARRVTADPPQATDARFGPKNRRAASSRARFVRPGRSQNYFVRAKTGVRVRLSAD